MKKVYVGVLSYDYVHNFYQPLTHSDLATKVSFVFPNNHIHTKFDSKKVLRDCDFFIAEMSAPTINLGVEMGYSDALGVPIIGTCERGTAISTHLMRMCKHFIEYGEFDELINEIEKIILK